MNMDKKYFVLIAKDIKFTYTLELYHPNTDVKSFELSEKYKFNDSIDRWISDHGPGDNLPLPYYWKVFDEAFNFVGYFPNVHEKLGLTHLANGVDVNLQ